jgi:hypothetical protein
MKLARSVGGNLVWKTGFVLALTALTLIKTPTMTAATNPTADITRDDSADGSSASVARSGTVSHGPIAIHPFIDVAAIENSKTEIFVPDAANNVVNIYNTSGKADRQGNGCMNPERWQQIRDLLEQALELAPEQRGPSRPLLRFRSVFAARGRSPACRQRRCALQLFAILYYTGDNARAGNKGGRVRSQVAAGNWRHGRGLPRT